MIIVEANNNIHKRWRNKDGVRQEEVSTTYRPYFFIERGDEMPQVIESNTRFGVNRIRPTYTFGEWESLSGKPLVKVYFETMGDLYKARENWDTTYEADISMARKYTNDEMEDIVEYDLRKWFLDIETQVGGRYNGAINALCFYDSYDKEYNVMTWFPREPLPQYDNILVYEDEEEMLKAFVEFVEDKDPDMIIGWYILGFDIPTIIKRLVKNDINPRRLSPYNEVKGVTHNKVNNVNYNNYSQPIKGRITYCLMSRFERLWIDSQKGTLPSLSLDYCSRRLLGEDIGKEKSNAKFDDDEFFQRSWLEDTEVFLEYNRVDVELMVKIDELMNITENDLALQRLMICPFDCVFHNSQMGAAYFMRHANWKAPTGVKGNKIPFEAAFVMDPVKENTFGLHRDIAVFDFKSLYPSMMASRNISWETKRTQGYEVDFTVPKNLRDWDKGTPSVCYSKEDLGILPKAVLSMMKLRDEYKANRKNAKTDEEYRKWDSAQMATKRAVNAFYGVLAKDGYGWGDMEMAQSITASAREAMRSVAFKAIELGYKVIYGHTDSIFVQVKDVADAEALCLLLNQYIRNEVFNECVELEFEKYAKTFFLSKKKNRYCGYLSWKDGEYIDDEFFVMGFEMKKSNETKVAKTFQKTVLQMVASSKSEEEVTDYARKLYKEIIKGDVDFKEVIKRSRLRTPLEEYKSIAGGVAGVLFYNEQGIGEIEVGDSYYFYTVNNKLIKGYPRRYEFEGRIRDVDYIACKKIDEVIDNFPINWERIAESEIVKKVNLIYDSLDWNLNEISQTGKQLSLSEWW
tara:strand:- start:266 stop:2665 length:2400 start_codon:yes stop_codon:yes gene_type:complete